MELNREYQESHCTFDRKTFSAFEQTKLIRHASTSLRIRNQSPNTASHRSESVLRRTFALIFFALHLSTQSQSHSLHPLLRSLPHIDQRKASIFPLIVNIPPLFHPRNVRRQLHVGKVPSMVCIEVRPAVEAAAPETVQLSSGGKMLSITRLASATTLRSARLTALAVSKPCPMLKIDAKWAGVAEPKMWDGSCAALAFVRLWTMRLSDLEGCVSEDSTFLADLGCCTYWEACHGATLRLKFLSSSCSPYRESI
jgi:hypothetical protein